LQQLDQLRLAWSPEHHAVDGEAALEALELGVLAR